MLKIGDKVVCIDDSECKNSWTLSINKIYTIKALEDWYLKLYETEDYIYDINRFVPLKDYRKQKLEEINENII